MATGFAGDVKIGVDLETKSAEQSLNSFRSKMKSAFTTTGTQKTDVNVKKVEQSMRSLERQVDKTQQKLQVLGTSTTPPKSVISLQKELEKAIAKSDSLGARIEQVQIKRSALEQKQARSEQGLGSGLTQREQTQLSLLNAQFRELQAELNRTVDIIDTLQPKLEKLQTNPKSTDEARALNTQLDEQTAELQRQRGLYSELTANAAKRTATEVSNTGRMSSATGGVLTDLGNRVSSFGNRIIGLAKRVFIFSVITKALRALRSALSGVFISNNQFANSLAQIKGNLWTAFAPIYEAILPALNALMSALATATAYLAAFISMLFGKSVSASTKSAKALRQQASAAKAAGGAAKQAGKDAEEAAKSMLSFDELNVIESDKDTSGGDGGGGGGGGGDTIGADFQEVDTGMWDKLKSILQEISDLFMTGFWHGFEHANWDGLVTAFSIIRDKIFEIATDPEVQTAGQNFASTFITSLGTIVGSVGAIGVNIATGLFGGMALTLSTKAHEIKKWLVDMFNIESEVLTIWANLFNALAIISKAFGSRIGQEFFESIFTFFWTLQSNLLLLFAKLGRDILDVLTRPIIENADKIETAIENTLKPLTIMINGISNLLGYLFDKINEMYDQHLKPFFDNLGKGFSSIFGTLLDAYNNYIAPVLTKFAEGFSKALEKFQPFIDAVTKGWGEMADRFSKTWNNLIVPIINGLINFFAPILATVLDLVGNTINFIISFFADLVSGLAEIWNNIINFIEAIFAGDWQAAWDSITGIFQSWIDTMGKLIGDIVTWFNNGIESIKQLWQPAIDFIQQIWQNIATWFQQRWDKIKTDANALWTAITGYFQNLWNDVTGIFETIGQWFQERWDAITTGANELWTNVQSYFQGLWDNITTIFDTIGQWFQERWDAITTGANTLWTNVKGYFQSLWDDVTRIFETIGTWFGERWTEITTAANTLWENVSSYFSGLWTDISTTFSTIGETFKGWFDTAWTNIKDVFSDWGSFFQGLWDTIVATFTELGTKLGDAIGGAVKAGINSVLSWVETTINSGIGIINGAIGVINMIPGVSVGTIPTISIPRLAQGAVIPPNKEFLAVLGDQKQGTNIEAPLDTIKQAVREELNNRGISDNSNITINFTGDLAQLARVLKPQIDKENTRRGTSLVVGGAY